MPHELEKPKADGETGGTNEDEQRQYFLKVDVEQAEQCYIHGIPQTGAPYHIINATMQTVGSGNPKWRERGGDNFIFSPLFSGSEATGYMRSAEYVDGGMNLATACAISGAAVNANSYATRSKALGFFMTLLNIRLGLLDP